MSGQWTSVNRPVNPFFGQSIVEIDTGNWLVYYGPDKGWCAPWNLPWGEIDYKKVAATGNYFAGPAPGPNSTRNNPANLNIAATLQEGRKYQFELDAETLNTAGSGPNGVVHLQIGDRSLETSSDLFDWTKLANQRQFLKASGAPNPTAYPVVVECLVTVGDTVSKTFDFRGARDGFSGSRVEGDSTHFQLHDVGPSGDVNTDIIIEGWDISKWDFPSGVWR